jgi:hypothetical protein
MADDIQKWFGELEATHVVFHRSIIQSMPENWQKRFLALVTELSCTCTRNGVPVPKLVVVAVDEGGKLVADPLADHQHGKRDVFQEAAQHRAKPPASVALH